MHLLASITTEEGKMSEKVKKLKLNRKMEIL